MATTRAVADAEKSRSSENVVLILGATSGIARALAHRLAVRGHELVLAGRDAEEIERLVVDLRVRHQVRAAWIQYDATDFNQHPQFFADCNAAIGRAIGGVVLCQGTLTDQAEAESDFTQCRMMIEVNYTAAVSLLNLAAAHLAARGEGFICASPRSRVTGAARVTSSMVRPRPP